MIVVVFRARVRAGLSPELEKRAAEQNARMLQLGTTMPGFVSYKDFVAEDGENVTIVEFETQEHSAAWRDHPEHRAVQQWGREALYSEYQIQVCEVARVSRFRAQSS
jgi:heme-degrading monooxygenase HmoA